MGLLIWPSEEKAKEAVKKCQEQVRYDLDPLDTQSNKVDDYYDILVEEFDVD